MTAMHTSVSMGITGYTLSAMVVKNSRAPLNARMVAVYIAQHHNSRIGYAFPSRSKIAEDLGISTRSVDRYIAMLVELDEWVVWSGHGYVRTPDGAVITPRSNRYYPTEKLISGGALEVDEDVLDFDPNSDEAPPIEETPSV